MSNSGKSFYSMLNRYKRSFDTVSKSMDKELTSQIEGYMNTHAIPFESVNLVKLLFAVKHAVLYEVAEENNINLCYNNKDDGELLCVNLPEYILLKQLFHPYLYVDIKAVGDRCMIKLSGYDDKTTDLLLIKSKTKGLKCISDFKNLYRSILNKVTCAASSLLVLDNKSNEVLSYLFKCFSMRYITVGIEESIRVPYRGEENEIRNFKILKQLVSQGYISEKSYSSDDNFYLFVVKEES